MIWEILIILSLAGIFIIILRRLPEAAENEDTSTYQDTKFWAPSFPKENIQEVIKSEETVNNIKQTEILSDTSSTSSADANKQTQADKLIEEAEKLFGNKRYRQAEQIYIQAAALDPDNAKIYNRLGAIYLEQKNFRDAREAFHTALSLDLTVPSRNVNLGLAYLGMKKYQDALSYFQKALELDPASEKYQKLVEDTKVKIS